MKKLNTLKIKKIALWCLAILSSIALILFIVLKIGLNINRIETHLFSVKQLYIKLDKKLVVKAEKIHFFDKNEEESEFDVNQIMDMAQKLKYLYFFFEELNINELAKGEERLSVAFKEGEFRAKHELFTIVLSIIKTEHTIHARVNELILAGTDANVSVDLSIDTNTHQYNFAGTLESSRTYFDFILSATPKQAFFRLDNIIIKDIKHLFHFLKQSRINLGPNVTAWVSDKAAAKYYHFDFVQGALSLGANARIVGLEGTGFAEGLIVKIDKDIEDIQIPRVDMNLTKEKLDFNFNTASFNGKDISQSKIFIYDIAQPEKAGISVGIKSNELMLDDKLQALLHHFGIKIPLTQLSGNLTSDFVINLPFSNPKNNDYKGDFVLEEAEFDKTHLLVHSGKIKLEDKKLFLNEFEVNNDFLSSNLSATINLAEKSGVFDVNVSSLYFDGLLYIQNKPITLNLSFKDDILLNIDEWSVRLNFTDGLMLTSSNLAAFAPYSPLMQSLHIASVGNFTLNTKDFVNFDIKANNTHFDYGLFRSDMQGYNDDDFVIEKRKDSLRIQTTSGLISANMEDNVVYIDAKNLYYRFKDSAQMNTPQAFNIDLQAKNFGLLLEDFGKTLHFDSLNLSAYDGSINASANKKNAKFELRKSNKELYLKAEFLNDEFVNTFFRKYLVEKGKFGIVIKGDSEKSFEGKIVFNNTYFKELHFHNQLISFIDTIPSLALFKSPTFNEKGLKVKKGAILFSRYKDDLAINALTFNGDSVDVLGIGDINLKKDTIDLELELRTLKAASELISKVPIVNQIILGKDRVISTQILVKGTIDKPKFQSQIIKEALQLPFSIIKNIIEMPATWGK